MRTRCSKAAIWCLQEPYRVCSEEPKENEYVIREYELLVRNYELIIRNYEVVRLIIHNYESVIRNTNE